ncbi:TonB-dependent receptor [Pseudoalteromonas piratica]|uniref:TonB-dependent receptor n=1 Tax=Pseudoalteromonas piratica TaxID=1348114 RepID=A0A0A7EKM9_9GAMM|nr:TonB-dependent receptor [Pseudoalteromonas piratica]AIY67194.1 TonB-dependent receptor [Pseudoalteromonas piratica]
MRHQTHNTKNQLRNVTSKHKPMLVCIIFCSSNLLASNTQTIDLDTIEIRGIHKSLVTSLADKKEHQSISDVLSAQEIGKFPDKNVAEALQRVTGISLTRVMGEGERVGVRGTTPGQNRTFLNGQNIASADWWISSLPNRGFNYTMLPAELVNKLEVFKTPQAQQDEGSLGGAINIKTHRPLTTETQFITTIQGQYSDLSDEMDPQLSVFYNHINPDKDFGVLFTLTRHQRTLRRDGLESWGWHSANFDVLDNGDLFYSHNDSADIKSIWTPGGGGSAIFQQKRLRTSATMAIDYQPSNAWQFELDLLYSELDADNSNQNFLWLPTNVFARGGVITDYQIDDNTLTYANYSQVSADDQLPFSTSMEAIWRQSNIQTNSINLKADHTIHFWQNSYQFGFTRGSGGTQDDNTSQWSANSAFSVDTRTKRDIQTHYQVDPLSARDWLISEVRNDSQHSVDQEWYLQADFTKALIHTIIDSIDFGAKYRNHKRDFIRNRSNNGGYNDINGVLNWILADFDAPFPDDYLSGIGSDKTLKAYAFADTATLANEYKHYPFKQQIEQASRFDIQEQTTAVYGKLNLVSELFTSNVGVRIVNTQQDAGAYQQVSSSSAAQPNYVWQQQSKHYTDLLPSFNLNFDLSEDVLMRFGAAKVMARAEYHHLMPSTNYNVTQAQGQGGNPSLDPYRASQYDLSLEWYFSDLGLLSIATFAKDVKSFIEFNRQLETHEGVLMTIDRPINGAGGHLWGLEVSYQQEFFQGLGVITNYTYVNGDRDGEHTQSDIPGTSEHTINVTGYYENDWFSARLSHNYRTKFATGIGTEMADDFSQIDATFSYYVTPNISLNLEGLNLTDEITYLYEGSHYSPKAIYRNGRRIYLGVRFVY